MSSTMNVSIYLFKINFAAFLFSSTELWNIILAFCISEELLESNYADLFVA